MGCSFSFDLEPPLSLSDTESVAATLRFYVVYVLVEFRVSDPVAGVGLCYFYITIYGLLLVLAWHFVPK